MKRIAIAIVVAGVGLSAQSSSVVPGSTWSKIADPTTAGYCSAGLDAVTTYAKTLGTTGLFVSVGGRELYEYGDVKTLSYLASVRKSILAMLYGNYVQSGKIKLDATMADLKIDDVGGLLPKEKEATVLDLLQARSGVYHEAANAACTGCGSTAGDPPGPRGSVAHGSYFLYNNWDFNALGTIFEQQTGQGIYDAFQKDLATPMTFEDFDRAAQRKSVNERASIHPAYHFYLSTRDMARIGLLMLRKGDWAGKQLVPRDWTSKIVTTVTHLPDMHPDDLKQGPFGYALLWWIWDGKFNTGIFEGAYTGIGAVGQYITVLPKLDMVIAHKTVANSPKPVSRTQYLEIIDRLVKAKCR